MGGAWVPGLGDERHVALTTMGSTPSSTAPEDTARLVSELVDAGVEAILYAGGDGTTRDIVIRGHAHHRCPKAFSRIHGPNADQVSDYKGLSFVQWASRERLSRGMVVVGTPRPTTTRCLARARARGARREGHRSSCHRRARLRRARCARGRADSRARVV